VVPALQTKVRSSSLVVRRLQSRVAEGSFRRDSQQLSLWQRRTHLPNPIDTGTAMLAYSVWARATRAGSALMASCFTNQTSGDTFSKIDALVVSLSELNLGAPAGLVIGSSLYRL